MIQETAYLLGYENAVFLDDAVKDKDVVGKCCDYKNFLEEYDTAVAALGDNNMRLYWTEKLMEAGYQVKRGPYTWPAMMFVERERKQPERRSDKM